MSNIRTYRVNHAMQMISIPLHSTTNSYHLGNNDEVVDAKGVVQQVTNYYPFGAPYADASATLNSNFQPYKYNGKELDRMHGLNTYDYGARQHDPILARWDRMDPLCEKFYSTSPYAYCANSPIAFIDIDGGDSVYYNEAGKELFRYGSDKTRTIVFGIMTTKTTAQLGSMNPDQASNSCPISVEDATTTEEQLSKGVITGNHMKNVTCFGTLGNIKGALKAIKDNGQKGASKANNREYSGNYTFDGVKDCKEGPYVDPSTGGYAKTIGNPDWHSHPSGTVKKGGYTYGWQDPPSKQDMLSMGRKKAEYVYSMGNNTLYKYTPKGVIATLPLSIFK